MTTVDLRRVRSRQAPGWSAEFHIEELGPLAPWLAGLGRHRRQPAPSARVIAAALLLELLLLPARQYLARHVRLVLTLAGVAAMSLGVVVLYQVAARDTAHVVALAGLVAASMAWDAVACYRLPGESRHRQPAGLYR